MWELVVVLRLESVLAVVGQLASGVDVVFHVVGTTMFLVLVVL